MMVESTELDILRSYKSAADDRIAELESQLAAARRRAEMAEEEMKEDRRRAVEAERYAGICIAEKNTAEADRDRLRDALEDLRAFVGVMFGDKDENYPVEVRTPLGVPVKLRDMVTAADAALNATGEAAIADEHHHGGLPDIMSVAEARRREVGKDE